MHKPKTRGTADRRPSRILATPAAPQARAAPAQTDFVWPGMTRAQLREMVIEQIG